MMPFTQCQSLVFSLFIYLLLKGNTLPTSRTRQALLMPIQLFQPPSSTYGLSPWMSTTAQEVAQA